MTQRQPTLQDLEARLNAQERAIQLLANFARMADVSFTPTIEQQLLKWFEAVQQNTTTSDEEKARSSDALDQIHKLLIPLKQNFG